MFAVETASFIVFCSKIDAIENMLYLTFANGRSKAIEMDEKVKIRTIK